VPSSAWRPTNSRASTRFRWAISRTRNDDDAIASFETVYERWQQGRIWTCRCPAAKTGNEVLDRYVPVLTQLRMRHLDDARVAWRQSSWSATAAAIRLVSAVLAGVDGSFALDHHLANTESVVLAPITDGRWSCVQWSTLTPPFYPEPDVHPVEDAFTVSRPRWAEASAPHVHLSASQSTLNACTTSGVMQPSSVHSERYQAW